MRLDRLPVHITGFHYVEDQPLPMVSAKEFKEACYRVAHADRGSVESFDATLWGRNHYTATLRFGAERTAVLCNAIYRFVAFAPAVGADLGLDFKPFVAAPRLAERFETLTAFQPLDADWLLSEPQETLLRDLAAVERHEIGGWKPRLVGEVVFNNWD